MPDAPSPTETMTLGQLKALLDSLDIPDDAMVLMEVDSPDIPNDTIELPVARVVASRGYGEPSRVLFAWQ